MLDIDVLISCLIAFQIKHFLADYGLQNGYMLANKSRYLHPGGLSHAAIHGALSLPVLLAFAPLALGDAIALCLAEAAVHYHIDWFKARLNDRIGATPAQAAYWLTMGADQMLHQLTMLAMVWYAFSG